MFIDEKPQGEATEAPARTLKLSEAIRMGSMIRPQCLGKWALDGGSCAVMAAAEATGFPYWNSDSDALIKHILLRFGIPFSLIHDVWTKHDELRSREAVADWLEARGY